MKKYLLLILLFSLVIILGCSKAQQPASNYGYLAGKISIGPLCPIQTNPPAKECLANADTYKAWPISVWTYDKKTKIASINAQSNGAYVVDLAPGAYMVVLDKTPAVGSSNLPQTVSVTKGETTNLDIEIDTGIR